MILHNTVTLSLQKYSRTSAAVALANIHIHIRLLIYLRVLYYFLLPSARVPRKFNCNRPGERTVTWSMVFLSLFFPFLETTRAKQKSTVDGLACVIDGPCCDVEQMEIFWKGPLTCRWMTGRFSHFFSTFFSTLHNVLSSLYKFKEYLTYSFNRIPQSTLSILPINVSSNLIHKLFPTTNGHTHILACTTYKRSYKSPLI